MKCNSMLLKDVKEEIVDNEINRFLGPHNYLRGKLGRIRHLDYSIDKRQLRRRDYSGEILLKSHEVLSHMRNYRIYGFRILEGYLEDLIEKYW